MGVSEKPTLMLLDGNSLAFRAFYALPEELSTSDGFPSGALLGFADRMPQRRALEESTK